MSYHLILQERASYLHATVTGPRTAQNAMRFLKEVHEACVKRGQSDVLLEMNLSGQSLDVADIFRVISRQSPDAVTLRKIAYVDASTGDPQRAKFAATVALNRGVNVRLFPDRDSAMQWMSGIEPVQP